MGTETVIKCFDLGTLISETNLRSILTVFLSSVAILGRGPWIALALGLWVRFPLKACLSKSFCVVPSIMTRGLAMGLSLVQGVLLDV